MKQIRQTDHFKYQVDRFHFRDNRPLRLSSRVMVLVFNLSELVLDVFFKCDAWLLLNFAVDQVLGQLAEIIDYNNFVRMLAKMIQQEGLFPQVFEKTELFQSHVLRNYKDIESYIFLAFWFEQGQSFDSKSIISLLQS